MDRARQIAEEAQAQAAGDEAQAPPEGDPVVVSFSAQLFGQPFVCGDALQHEGEAFSLNDLRFFVSNVRLVDASGAETAAAIVPDGAFQQADVAMIDLAGSGGSCDGTEATHDTLSLVAPAGDYARLLFTLGVPFERNHQDPTTAGSPLDQMAMHWGWRGGYRFLKFDADRGDAHVTAHFGSTGCEGPMRDIQSCARPCRAEVDVALDDDGVVLQLDTLMPETGGAVCMAAPGDEDCLTTLAALALDDDTCVPQGPAGLFR